MRGAILITELNTGSIPAADTGTDLTALWPWYSVEMLGSCGTTLMNAGIYWYAADVLKASDSARLWLAATFGYAYIIIAIYGGKLADRWGPRRSGRLAIGGCVIAAMVGLLCTRVLGFVGLGIAMLLFNITSTTLWPAIETAIANTPGNLSLSTRMGLYNILWSTTNFIGFFTVGKIHEQGSTLTFFLAAGLTLIGFVVLSRFTRPVMTAPEPHDDPADEPEKNPGTARRAVRLLYMAWVGNALAYVAIQTLIPMIPTLTRIAHLDSPAQGAAVSSLWAFSRTIFFIVVLRWTRWHYSVRYLLGFQLLLVVTFFMVMRLDHLGLPGAAVIPVFLLSQVGFGLATGFVYSSSLYYAMHVSKGAGGHAGFHEALIGFGLAIGPTIGAIAGGGNDRNSLLRVACSVTAMLALGTILMMGMGWTARRSTLTSLPT